MGSEELVGIHLFCPVGVRFILVNNTRFGEQKNEEVFSDEHVHMSGDANYLPKLPPISFFRRVSRFIGVSGDLALQQGKS